MHLTVILALLGAKFAQSRDLWSPDLPDGPVVSLEKNQPIQLSKNYTSVQLCQLEGTTLYSDSLSKLDGITELKICKHQLSKIEKGSLCASSTIKVLDIDFFNNRHNLTLSKESFENCQNLEELLLKFDNFDPPVSQILQLNVFDELTNLKKLAIQGYPINHLTRNFLKVANLKELFLSFGNIQQIDNDVFDTLPNLEILYIVNNPLKHLPKNLFKSLNKLKILNLRDNALSNLTWDEFKGLSSLQELTLADNLIAFFDADKIAENLPNLQKLEIDINPISCEQKTELVNKLTEKIKHPVEVSFETDLQLGRPCD